MFPLTHALAAQQLIKKGDSQVVLGSVFPDLANIIGLNRDLTHVMGADFYQFCRREDQNFLNLAQGIISHGAAPQGMDYYADQSYAGQEPGYCFQRALPIVEQVVEVCALPPKMGWWKAHNFIEMAFEMMSMEENSDLIPGFMAVVEDRGMQRECAQFLGHYFGINDRKVDDAWQRMPEFFCLEEVTPLNLMKKYATQLKERHGILKADPPGMAMVLEEARELIAHEYTDFMRDTLGQMAGLWQEYPGAKVK